MKPVVPHWRSFFEIKPSQPTSFSPKATDGRRYSHVVMSHPITLLFVICPLAEAQALVHQGEQSHVIGCFHLCPS